MEQKPVTIEEQIIEVAPAPKKRRKWPVVLLVLVLMGLSFLVGWRLMAYRWWPEINTPIKQFVYSIIPSLKPDTPAPVEAEPYHPDNSARLGEVVLATDSLFYYFYQPTCPYCATHAEMVLAGLPDTITLPDGTQSRVLMVALNKHDEAEGAVVEAYYEAKGIIKNDEQNDRVVPSIAIGDVYLRGTAEIREQFLRMLLSGEGLNTPTIDGAARLE